MQHTFFHRTNENSIISKLSDAQNTLVLATQTIHDLTDSNREKDTQISLYMEQIRQQKEKIDELNKTIQERDRQINTLNERLGASRCGCATPVQAHDKSNICRCTQGVLKM